MISKVIAGLMGLATLTFVIASLLHFGVALPLGVVTINGEPFRRAAIPEGIIAAVLAAGSVVALTRRPTAWWLALATSIFAVLGVIVGLSTIAIGVGPRTVPDITYHISVLVLLLVIVGLLVTPGARRAFGRSAP